MKGVTIARRGGRQAHPKVLDWDRMQTPLRPFRRLEGEVIGCGVRRRGADVTMFFTRNGRFVGDFWSRPVPAAVCKGTDIVDATQSSYFVPDSFVCLLLI